MKLEKNIVSNYLVTNSNDELWGLHATTVGYQAIPPNSCYPPKKHPPEYYFNPEKGRTLQVFEIIYIISGEGEFESANCKLTKVSAGTIIILFPNEWHTYRPANDIGWNEYWIGFGGEFVNSLIKNNFFSRDKPVIYIGFNEQLITHFKHALEISTYQKSAHQQLLAGLINLLISEVYYLRENNSFREKEIVSQIEKATVMMIDNIETGISHESIASSLNMSYSWFRRAFKQYTGLTPTQFEQSIRIQKSTSLLTNTKMQVKEIAYTLNFESLSYFVTFFKSKTGFSPQEYRRHIGMKL